MMLSASHSEGTDAEGYVVCPYEKAHVITRARLSFHLVKCRRNHEKENSDKVLCRYNVKHVIPRVEKTIHEASCQDRLGIDKFMLSLAATSGEQEAFDTQTATFSPPRDEYEENWDHVESGPSVIQRIEAEAEKKEVFRTRQTASSKAVKKAYREQEKARFMECETKDDKPRPAPVKCQPLKKEENVKPKPANNAAVVTEPARAAPPGFGNTTGISNAPPGFINTTGVSNAPPGFTNASAELNRAPLANAWGQQRVNQESSMVNFELSKSEFPKLELPIGRGRRPPPS